MAPRGSVSHKGDIMRRRLAYARELLAWHKADPATRGEGPANPEAVGMPPHRARPMLGPLNAGDKVSAKTVA